METQAIDNDGQSAEFFSKKPANETKQTRESDGSASPTPLLYNPGWNEKRDKMAIETPGNAVRSGEN